MGFSFTFSLNQSIEGLIGKMKNYGKKGKTMRNKESEIMGKSSAKIWDILYKILISKWEIPCELHGTSILYGCFQSHRGTAPNHPFE